MLVVMKAQASEEQVRAVCEKIEKLGYRAHPMPGATRTAIGITGNKGEVEQGTLEEMPKSYRFQSPTNWSAAM
jgi:3-deoxy-7-phosphoheptulonate synthase